MREGGLKILKRPCARSLLMVEKPTPSMQIMRCLTAGLATTWDTICWTIRVSLYTSVKRDASRVLGQTSLLSRSRHNENLTTVSILLRRESAFHNQVYGTTRTNSSRNHSF